MGLASFTKIQTADRDLMSVQASVDDVFKQILSQAILNGNILTRVALVTGENIVNHGLGQKLLGWVLVRNRAHADLWDAQDDNPNPTKTLILEASANTTVDLLVF